MTSSYFLKRAKLWLWIFPFAAICLTSASHLQASLSSIPEELEQLTIQESGRRKPYLVFAEETVRSLSGSTAVLLNENGKETKVKAAELITSWWLEPQLPWASQPLLLVASYSLKKELGLPAHQKLFSYDTLSHNEALLKLIAEATAEQRRGSSTRLQGLLKEASEVGMRLSLFDELQNGSLFRIVPNSKSAGARWASLPEWEQLGASADAETAQDVSSDAQAAMHAFDLMQQGWSQGEASIFNQGVMQLSLLLQCLNPYPVPHWKLQLEVFYQKAHPFRWAWILYVCAGFLLLFSQRAETSALKKPWSYRMAWLFAGTGFFFQFMGLLMRVMIAGRPPVTNIYEVVIWVAFGTIFFGLLFEMIFHSGLFLLGAIPVAVASLILADSQPMILDPSIRPLMPVLRDNLWLTIHVLTITLSYAAFSLSLGIAHIILIRILLGHKIAPTLYNYLYRTLQVGVLLLAIGTILGGVWANYSWGRFWDWDPKETWALITLLCYLFLLHGRIAGRWGGFGLTIGAVIAFLSVLMVSYGVNFVLGVGLHSYGFGTGGFPLVLSFVGLELLLLVAVIICHKQKTKKVVLSI